jgi:hypothetical protein
MSKGEVAGGDQTETVTCPGCGAEICNTRWPIHFRGENCESGGESE